MKFISLYRVTIFVREPRKSAFEYSRDFQNDNLPECRRLALEYYYQQHDLVKEMAHHFGMDFFDYPSAAEAAQMTVKEKKCVCSVTLYFLHGRNANEGGYRLSGELDTESREEVQEFEADVFKSMGFAIPHQLPTDVSMSE